MYESDCIAGRESCSPALHVYFHDYHNPVVKLHRSLREQGEQPDCLRSSHLLSVRLFLQNHVRGGELARMKVWKIATTEQLLTISESGSGGAKNCPSKLSV